MASEQEKAAVLRELQHTLLPIVVDLGSYDASEYDWIAPGIGPLGRYIAVEPDPRRNFVIGVSAMRGERNLQSIQAAIGDYDGPIMLHLCDNTTSQAKASSSTHKPTGHVKYFPWCSFNESVEVKAIRLDTLFETMALPQIDLLWCDIQGAERDMIAGGTEALKRTRYIMIEAEDKELYEGQALKPELLSLLPDFEVIEDFGYNVFLKRWRTTERFSLSSGKGL